MRRFIYAMRNHHSGFDQGGPYASAGLTPARGAGTRLAHISRRIEKKYTPNRHGAARGGLAKYSTGVTQSRPSPARAGKCMVSGTAPRSRFQLSPFFRAEPQGQVRAASRTHARRSFIPSGSDTRAASVSARAPALPPLSRDQKSEVRTTELQTPERQNRRSQRCRSEALASAALNRREAA